MAKYKEQYETIVLNDKTKIIYDHKYNKKFDETKYIIENKNKNGETTQIVINFFKVDVEYDLFVYSQEKGSNTFHTNKLYICNDTYEPTNFGYERLTLKLLNGKELEHEQLIDINEQYVFNEIFLIFQSDNYFDEEDVLRSFQIITPLLKDLIKDFSNYRSKNILCNNKKLVKKN